MFFSKINMYFFYTMGLNYVTTLDCRYVYNIDDIHSITKYKNKNNINISTKWVYVPFKVYCIKFSNTNVP